MERQPEKSVTENLLRFVLLLRGLGLKISAAELVDALEALLLVDLANRDEVFQALCCTLVKDLQGEQAFNQAFRNYFEDPKSMPQSTSKKEELIFQEEPLQLTQEELAVYHQLTLEQQQNIQQFLAKSSEGKNVTSRFLPVVEGIVKGQLDFYKRQLPKATPVELTGDAELDSMLLNISQELSREEEALVHRDMHSFVPEELTKVKRAMHKLTRRLATRVSRRKRKANREGLLDLRNSLRHSIQHGGIIFRIKYRQKRKRKHDLLLICDVSGSMERYSSFVLQFCYYLSQAFRKMAVFFFAEKLVLANQVFLSNMSSEDRLSQAQMECGRGTDLNKSLKELQLNYSRMLGKNKIIVVVSDAKTTDAQAAALEIKKMAGRSKAIIWLNPLDKSFWDSYAAIKLLSRYCRMEECSTLAQLDKVMHKVLL